MVQRLLVAGGARLEKLPPEAAAAATGARAAGPAGAAMASCPPTCTGSGLRIIGHMHLTPLTVLALTAYCGAPPLLYNWVFDSVSHVLWPAVRCLVCIEGGSNN